MDGEPPSKRTRRDTPSTSRAQESEDEMDRDSPPSEAGNQLEDGQSEQRSTDETSNEDFFTIKSSSTRYIKRFKTDVNEHIIHFSGDRIAHHIEEQENIIPHEFYGDLFQRIIDTILGTFPERDRILIEIHLPGSDRPIYVPIMQVHEVNAEAILNAFEQVQQSNRKIKLDGRMELHVIHIEVPDGQGDGNSNDLEDEFLKGKKSVIRIKNRDNMCLARALVTARAKLEHVNGDTTVNWENIRKGLREQTRLATALQKQAGACPASANILDDVPKFQNVMTDFQILIVPKTGYQKTGFLFKGTGNPSKKLYILFTGNHFHVITSMTGFLECGYFCERCWKGFKTFEHHRCTNMCECCFNNVKNGCIPDKWQNCADCNRWFKSVGCFENHKKVPEAMTNSKKGSRAKTVCERIKFCVKCQSTIKDQHKCGYAYCSNCKSLQPSDHLCFMQRIRNRSPENCEGEEDDESDIDTKNTNKTKEQKYIFFDFECRQDEKGENDENIHVVNYCVAQRVCDICMHRENVKPSCKNCNSLEECFQGDEALDDFCKWLLLNENWNAIAIAHNMKGYDGHFILNYLIRVGLSPKVIKNGSKLMVIRLKKIKIIDSLNFIPFPLSAFSKTFGIETKKGYFPHLFNKKGNEAYKGAWPNIKYYSPEEMKVEERNDLYKWYDQQLHKEFDMSAEIYNYCSNDVTLLRRGCSQFRSYFSQTTGDEPFQTSLTIASACLRVFKRNFLKENTIAIVPTNGYRKDKQSVEALQWLGWMETMLEGEGAHIQHSENGGEKKIENYKVDGFCESNSTIYEFNGCYWHGCLDCYPNRSEKGRGNETMGDKFERYLHRKKDLEQKHHVEEIWECKFKEQLQKDENMRTFVQSLDITGPLEPRDAFYGGRTNVIKLHHVVKPGECIKYIDVCSLYPWVNKYGKYPIGHPDDIISNPLTTDIQQYEGLIKCTILPPGDLFHPVLPYRCEGKLLFPLCATCVKQRSIGKCLHTDDERALRGTWVTDEIKKAVEKGYRVTKVHEVWHFKETSQYDPKTKQGGLFTKYVNTFLKLKQEADGWPSDCKTDLQKTEFINEYREKEGIDLSVDDVKRNTGKRALAKLMLNSFWGKFGQRPNLPQTEYVQKLERFYKILLDDTKVIRSILFVSDSMVQIEWQDKNENLMSMSNTNVFIAAYTTALARLKLYYFLEQLDRRVLYFDTDSIIYLSKGVQGEYEPPTGKFLGDMTDELSKAYGEGSYIKEFLSGGPKNYAYRVNNPSLNKEFFECKVKGITMNFEARKQINMDVMKKHLEKDISEDGSLDEYSVERLSEVQTPIHNQLNIRAKGGMVSSKQQTKKYRIVSDKRRVKKDFTTLPFGYKSE